MNKYTYFSEHENNSYIMNLYDTIKGYFPQNWCWTNFFLTLNVDNFGDMKQSPFQILALSAMNWKMSRYYHHARAWCLRSNRTYQAQLNMWHTSFYKIKLVRLKRRNRQTIHQLFNLSIWKKKWWNQMECVLKKIVNGNSI